MVIQVLGVLAVERETHSKVFGVNWCERERDCSKAVLRVVRFGKTCKFVPRITEREKAGLKIVILGSFCRRIGREVDATFTF